MISDATTTIAVNPLPPVVRKLWRITAVFTALVFAAIFVVIGAVQESEIAIIGGPLAALVVMVSRIVLVNAKYHRWRWGYDDRWVEQHSGVFVHRTQVVPRSRVQTVTTHSGPLDRWLGLTSVVIHTAGTRTPNLQIPHIEEARALVIREELGS